MDKNATLMERVLKLVNLIEDQLVQTAGLEDKTAESHCGRSDGPKISLKCPLSVASGTQRTTPTLRAWKATWKWLGDLLHHCPHSPEAEKVRSQIIKHNHKLGNPTGEEGFIRWRQAVSLSILQH